MTTLSDGTQTGWAKNGQTAGTMGRGLHLTGYRLAFFVKGTAGNLNTSNPLAAATAAQIPAGPAPATSTSYSFLTFSIL